ncbi:ornithine acetyltransferase [Candidatus Heimdallarchaeota archaeon]|nr:MAG: ornithine acetyltransferase [Candidatus Heimdallarchaeota archaeon]
MSDPGFLASGISSGIKEKNKKDLGMLFSEQPATAVGVFTTNKIKAAPVLISKEKIKQKNSQAIIVNSGNANACTGDMGLKDASDLCKLTAQELGISEKLVMVSSTGIIGVTLPMDKMKTNIPHLVNSLSPMGLNDFAEAIMTTDTIPKIVMKKAMINSKEVKFCGIAKGSGMIMPRMATLLAFIITDVAINPDLLDDVFIEAVNNSFNRITIDGETSTNDMVIMMANGRAENSFFSKESSDYQTFKSSLNALFSDLSKLILRDAEGATKTIYVRVEEAKSNEEAKKIAFQIANSNLVKTAFFGEDPNWGRILSAIGTVDAEIIPGRIDISFDDVIVVENSTSTGMELQAKQILVKKEFQVTINLHIGQGTAEVGTTDLTTEYVKINASYPS